MNAAAAWFSRKPWTAFALVACVCASACNGCDKNAGVLATLASTNGEVTRDLAAAPQGWKAAQNGDTFRLGDGIKTGSGAGARLTLSDGSALAVQEKAVLRFLAARPEEHNFNVEVGQVWIEAGTTPLRFGSSVGLAVLEPGGRMIVTQEGKKTRYEVTVGMANFTRDSGEPIKVLAGQRIQVDLETAQIERLVDVAKAVVDPVAAPEPEAATPKGDIAATVRGKRVKYRATETDTWSSLDPGDHEVAAGGTFDVPALASVRVARGDEAATVHGRGVFRVGGKRGLVEANVGRVSVDRAAGETVIVVPGGSIAVRGSDSAADVAVDKSRGTQLRVRDGSAAVQTSSGSDEISAGETLMLDPQGRMRVDGRGPEVADLVVEAGESFVVHDPSPPTAVQVKFPSTCTKGGRLRVGASRFVLPRSAELAAIANMQPGIHRYAVVCAGSPEVTGSVQIIRDPGTADLPRLAPATLVDTDGRKYTILYQNLLPEVRLSWPSAPKAASYQVVLTTGDKTKTFSTPKPKYVFKSGSLPEANHSLLFKTVGESPASSPETTVKIRFDNAAPAAVVKTPQNKHFKAGDTVEVAGSALPGWVVTAAGSPLPLDPNLRFAGQVHSAAERRSLAIRFEHKERGVHYYLRRSAGRMP